MNFFSWPQTVLKLQGIANEPPFLLLIKLMLYDGRQPLPVSLHSSKRTVSVNKTHSVCWQLILKPFSVDSNNNIMNNNNNDENDSDSD